MTYLRRPSAGHDWHRPVIAAPRGKPPVRGWVTCSACGAQLCRSGAGVYLRPTSRDEWTLVEWPEALLCRPS